MTSGQSPHCTPNFPHCHVGTRNSKSDSQSFSTTPPLQSLSRMNWNSKSPKSLSPRLTTIIMPASYCILTVGQGMRALIKRIPGSLLPNSDMLSNLLWISTLHIQPILVLFQVFESSALHFLLKSYSFG